MIRIRVAHGCGPTGRILSELLKKNGVDVSGPTEAQVCWGAGGATSLPTLNGNCSRFNKLQQLDALDKAGILVVPFGRTIPPFRSPKFPILARRLKHVGGRDIILCRTPLRARRALRRGRAYFTQFVESSTEFRVWVYRHRHLGTYEKTLDHPELKHRAVGRNYKNGYAFHLLSADYVPRSAVGMAVRAIDVLGLDFGAVDILAGLDGKFYVLEVNTAPGVEGEGRQVIQSLAFRIAKWAKAGFPSRRESEERGINKDANKN